MVPASAMDMRGWWEVLVSAAPRPLLTDGVEGGDQRKPSPATDHMPPRATYHISRSRFQRNVSDRGV